MQPELLKFHEQELILAQDGLRGWCNTAAPYGDEKCKQEHVRTFDGLVAFHKSAVDWLKSIAECTHKIE